MLNTPVMLENVYQDDAALAESEELSPVDQFRLQWTQQPGALPLLKQKNLIERYPDLLPYAGMASIKGWSWPYAFAFQGLLVAAIFASLLNWFLTHDSGKLHNEITNLQAQKQAEIQRQQGVMDATQAEIRRISRSNKETFNLHMADRTITRDEALQELNASLEDSRKSAEQYKERTELREKDLRATESALAIARSGSPFLFMAALVLAAGGVRRSLQKDYPRSRQTRSSGDYFLYFATSQGLWLNLVFLFFLHFALSGSSYGLSGFSESVGPLFWVVLWVGVYAIMLWFFAGVARSMYKALQIRPPANEWSPQNRVLLHIHNHFLGLLAVLEGTFLAACYLLYHADKRLF